MTTGKSYLSGDLGQDLGGRIRGDAWSTAEYLTDNTPSSHADVAMTSAAPALAGCSALPLRGLDPGVLDDVNDDIDDYAAHCLSSESIEALFEAVIATAEMRAGDAVVRDVLTSLASSPDGRTLAELAGASDDRAVSVAHVLSILGNHVHRDRLCYRLTPMLRAAIERRYPLAGSRLRPAIAAVLRSGHAAIEGALQRRPWRRSA